MNNYDNWLFFTLIFFSTFVFLSSSIWAVYNLEKDDKKIIKKSKKHKKA